MAKPNNKSVFRRRYGYCARAYEICEKKDIPQEQLKDTPAYMIQTEYNSNHDEIPSMNAQDPQFNSQNDSLAYHSSKVLQSPHPSDIALTDCSTADESLRNVSLQDGYISCSDRPLWTEGLGELTQSNPLTISGKQSETNQAQKTDSTVIITSTDLNRHLAVPMRTSCLGSRSIQKKNDIDQFQHKHPVGNAESNTVLSSSDALKSNSSQVCEKPHVSFHTSCLKTYEGDEELGDVTWSKSMNHCDPTEAVKDNHLSVLLEWKNRKIDQLNQKLHDQEQLYDKFKKHFMMTQSHIINELQLIIRHEKEQRNKAQIIASIRQQQYQDILKTLAIYEDFLAWYKTTFPNSPYLLNVQSKTAAQLVYVEGENFRMRQQIEELQFEKEQIQQVVLQKEKEVVFLKNLNPSLSEMSPLELSLKAISLVGEQKQSNDLIRNSKTQIEFFKQENQRLQANYEDLAKRLELKTQEIETLMEALAKRNRAVAEMETQLWRQRMEKEQQFHEHILLKNQDKEKYLQLEDELKITTEQLTRLREELAYRDSVILTLKSEVIRQSTYNKNAEAHILNLAKYMPRRSLSLTKDPSVEKKNSHTKKDRFSKSNLPNICTKPKNERRYQPEKAPNVQNAWDQEAHLKPERNTGRVSTIRRPTQSYLNKKVVLT